MLDTLEQTQATISLIESAFEISKKAYKELISDCENHAAKVISYHLRTKCDVEKEDLTITVNTNWGLSPFKIEYKAQVIEFEVAKPYRITHNFEIPQGIILEGFYIRSSKILLGDILFPELIYAVSFMMPYIEDAIRECLEMSFKAQNNHALMVRDYEETIAKLKEIESNLKQ